MNVCVCVYIYIYIYIWFEINAGLFARGKYKTDRTSKYIFSLSLPAGEYNY